MSDDDWMDTCPYFVAEVTFVPTSEGGRKTGIWPGYRADLSDFYDDEDWVTGVQFLAYATPSGELLRSEEQSQKETRPGETALFALTFLFNPAFFTFLPVGKVFDVREGERVVAKGRIIKVCPRSFDA